MNTERIKQIRDSKERARRRQERNYEDSGIGMYQSKAKQYEEIVEICDQALSVSADRDAAREIRTALMDIAENARRAEQNCRGCGGETPVVLNQIMQLARKHGWRARE